MTEVDVDGTMLDVEATFYYLGDMLYSGGDCDSATAARCCVAWGKFRKLLPILTQGPTLRAVRLSRTGKNVENGSLDRLFYNATCPKGQVKNWR